MNRRPKRRNSTVMVVLLTAVVFSSVLAACAPPPEPPGPPVAPIVTGPVTAGQKGPLGAAARSVLDHYGYTQAEYFYEGKALSFQATGPLYVDGKWGVTPAGQLPYKTRMLVRRPTDMSKFDGTVYVEWSNVSAGHDSDVEFNWTYPMVFSANAVYVSVSAQRVGVDGGGFSIGSIEGDTSAPLKQWDPDRYGSLTIPDDIYSYDIFTQAAKALRDPHGSDPLVGHRPEVLIAAGQSQSGLRLAGYINTVAKVANAYDAYLVHSRSTSMTGPSSEYALNSLIRDDIAAPVLQIQTETELGAGAAAVRQADTPTYRGWEIAGAAHVDRNLTYFGSILVGSDPAVTEKTITDQCGAVNDSQQMYVVRRALSDLDRWVRTDQPPAQAAPMELGGNQLVRDSYGNTKGGVRTPALDAPIATTTGTPTGGGLICGFFGSTTPLPQATLEQLYPTHRAYVAAVRAAVEKDIGAGYIRRADADEIIDAAKRADVP